MKALVFVSGLTLLASACGSSGSPSPSPAETASPSPDSAQQEDAEVLELGAQVYAANCQVCHGTRSGQGGMAGAPPHNETGHTWHHPDAQLKDWIVNGKITGAMPAFSDKISEAEVDAVLAFIKTWWTPEQRETQADVSRRYQEALDRQGQGQ